MSKFIHLLLLERIEYDETNLDEAGQPSPMPATTIPAYGLVQPKQTVSEADDYRSAGSEVADHTVFLPAGTDIRHADAILFGTERYNVISVRRFRYGGLAHLEVDARLITATATVAAGS